MVQDTYQNGVGSALFVSGVLSNSALVYIYALFIQATPVQVGPGPPKSAQVNQVLLGSPRFSQVPRKLVISCDFVGFRDFPGEPGCYFLPFCGFPGFPGRTWVLFSAFLWVSGISWENLGVIFCLFVGFRDFLGEPGCYFLPFCGFPGFPGRTWVLFSAFLWVSGISWENLGVNFCVFLLFSAFLWVSGISWENLGVIFCAFVGFPGFPGRTWVGPGRAARVSSGKSGPLF